MAFCLVICSFPMIIGQLCAAGIFLKIAKV